jgi:tetratricopeptide (TPR) repeat protein
MRPPACLRCTLAALVLIACLLPLPASGSDDDKVVQYPPYQNAQNLIKEKKYNEAIPILNEVLTRYPKAAMAYISRGAALSLTEQTEPALADAEHALQYARGTANEKIVKQIASRVYSQVGYLQIIAGQFDKGASTESQAIEFDPDYLVSYGRRGYAYYKLARYPQAIADFNRSLKGPFPAEYQVLLHTLIGRCYLMQGAAEQAKAEVQTILDLDPRLNTKYSGEHLLEIYDFDRRRQFTQQAIAAAEAAEQGHAAEAFARYEDAWQWPLIVVEIADQKDIDDYNAADVAAMRKVEEALRRLYPQLPARPALPEAARRYSVQAAVALREQRLEESIALFRQGQRVAPWWPEANFNLALLEAQKEQYQDAIKYMKTYLALAPGAPDVRQAQDKIYEWELSGKTVRTPKLDALAGSWTWGSPETGKVMVRYWGDLVVKSETEFEINPTRASAPLVGMMTLSRANYYYAIKVTGNKLAGVIHGRDGDVAVTGELEASYSGFTLAGTDAKGRAFSQHWVREK